MNMITILLIIVMAVSWIGILTFRTIRVSGKTSLSAYELHRRAETGEPEAKQLLEMHNRQPLFDGIFELMQIVLVVIAVLASSALFDTSVAFVVSALLGLVVLRLSQVPKVAQLSQKIWDRYEAIIDKKIGQWWWLEKLSRAEAQGNYQINSNQELQMLVEKSAHIFDTATRRRIKAGLAFDDYAVHEIMTPVSLVDSIDVSESLGPLVLDSLHKTAHSRFPVTDGDMNHVVGMLYFRDIVELRSAQSHVKDAMDSRVYFIHENQTLSHALHGFLRTHHHLFIVVNDYRETVGVVSLEDVLEKLVGHKIIDEFDTFDDLRAVAATNPNHNNNPKGTKDI